MYTNVLLIENRNSVRIIGKQQNMWINIKLKLHEILNLFKNATIYCFVLFVTDSSIYVIIIYAELWTVTGKWL